MESEGFKPDGPAEDVLSIPELLEKILTFCSYSDKHTLFSCRLVCSFWRDCVFSVFQSNPSSLANILDRERNSFLNSDDPDQDTALKRFCGMFEPPGFIPLRVDLCGEWVGKDSLYPKFFIGFSQNIVCMELDTRVFGFILGLTNYPNLRKITLYESYLVVKRYDSKEGFERVQDFFLTPNSNLTELILKGGTNIQLGTMTKLEVLRMTIPACLNKTVSVSNLLPNLRNISFGEQDCEIIGLKGVENFSSNGARFDKVVNLEIHEALDEEDFDLVVFNKTVNCFPNLRKLDWTSANEMSDRILPIRIIFTTLENLTSLRLNMEKGTASEIFELLTNLSVNEIPAFEDKWNDSIVNTTTTLLNLKNLRTFNLEHKDLDYYLPATDIPDLQSRFLLKAVFLRMENLRKILFGHIRYNSECIQIWQDSGRVFESIGLGDEDNDSDEDEEDSNN